MKAAVREERRLVTCMFVDVVGSTDLLTQLGAERLKRELGAAFAELSGIIAAHGGTVEKYIGDAIYAIFGAPVAHEDDPLRALRAAQALREWSQRGPSQRVPFSVRVGVETGEAVIDLEAAERTKQQMSVGPVVNIAARLQQRADPGEILVGPNVREATDGAADVEPLGEQDLKGVGKLAVWRLVAVGTARRASALPFVGRDAELSLLDHAFQRAVKGRSVLSVVSGPPGQGKTRLVQEFLDRRAEGSHVITTRCRPAEEVGVFAPVRAVLGVTTLDALADQVGRLCSDDVECERVVAGLAESAGIATSRSLSSLPAAEREDEIVQAWRRYVGLLGEDRLVILAIDDIHWADGSLVRLVDRLTFGGPRVLVVATARPEFAEAAGIRPTGDRFFIELEGLDGEDARRLAATAGRDDERVVARAEGNPLFIVELARAGERGDLPLTLQGALGARLDELAPAERTLLSFAAVAGERFTAADAAFLAERDLAEAGRALAHLTDLHFVDLSESGYRFHHGLVRDVAYGRLLTAERMKAHARFARERVHPENAETLAYHWWEALRPPDGEWVWAGDPGHSAMRHEAFEALLAAGRRHSEHFAVEPSAELLTRAASLAAGDRERAKVEQAMGTMYRRVLRQDEAWGHLMRAFELFRSAGGVPLDLHLDLVTTASYVGAFLRQPTDEEVAAIVDKGVALARATADQGTLSRILRAHGQFLINKHEGEADLAEPIIEAAIEAAEASGDLDALRNALVTKSSVRRMEGRPLDRSVFDDIERLLRSPDALDRMNFLRMRAVYEFIDADLAAAERTAIEAAELAEPMGPHNRTHAWLNLSEVYKARGDWQNLIDVAQRTARLVTESKASGFCTAAATTIRDGAIAQALAGQREEAIALLRAIPTSDIEIDLIAMVPRALLGSPSPESDKRLGEKPWGWWEFAQAAMRAVILGRPDAAEDALRRMGPISENSILYRAFAEAVREAIAGLRGGPPATYDPLRKIGFTGWVEILKRRVDAEY
jgi:class 3 adenylate cyclase/tetratricopeptide (TPR) repeat protein